MFTKIYPKSHTGASLRAKDKKDWFGVRGDESRLKRCQFCGFICDPDRDLRVKDGSHAGKGVSLGAQASTTYVMGGKTVTEYYYTPETVSGCPFCGSYRWIGE